MCKWGPAYLTKIYAYALLPTASKSFWNSSNPLSVRIWLYIFSKTDGVSVQTDININTFWQENYWTGLSFRYEDALCFLVGFQVANNLTFAYAFDLVTSKLNTQANGSHEVFLRYSFELDIIGRGDTRYRSVRFL